MAPNIFIFPRLLYFLLFTKMKDHISPIWKPINFIFLCIQQIIDYVLCIII